MAKELQAFQTSGLSLYAILLNSIGQVWNGSSWETVAAGNWAVYDLALTEITAGIYFADMPAIAAGQYNYIVYEGNSPSVADLMVGTGSIAWDGSAVSVVALEATSQSILEDTGTTLPTSIDAIATWAAANISSSVTAGAISQIRGNSWDFPIDDLTLDDTLIQFVIKNNANDLDEDSILMIDNVTGLLYVNGEAGTAGDASLAYAGTTLTVEVVASVTALLPVGVYHYGIQSIDGSGNVSEAYGGTFTITADMVRATA